MAAPGKTHPMEEDQRYPIATLFPPKSDSPARSVSTFLESSNGGSIYNALRATSDDDSVTTPGNHSDNRPLERVDTRMAANVATFHSISREQGRAYGGSAPDPPICDPDEISRPPRAHLVADKLRTAGEELKGWSMPDHLSEFHETSGSSPAKDPSVDVDKSADAASSSPKWPANIQSPVSPTLPEFPPPTRAPTPPGLPTFGTEEARTYDFRIGADHPVPSRSESLLRRLFQRTPATNAPSTADRQGRTRVYAEDGTAVLGSFPQRQSGHGTSILKGPNDHPFHQGNLPLAQCDGPTTETNDAVPEGADPTGTSSSSDRSARDAEDEATLRWLEENMPRSLATDSAAPPNGTLNPALLHQGPPNARIESYQTCVSRVPETTWRLVVRVFSNLSESLYFAPTQSHSAAPLNPQEADTVQGNDRDNDTPEWWKFVKKRAKTTCCCCHGSDESEHLNPSDGVNPNTTMNTTTQDTYVTARDQTSNESQQHPSTASPEGPANS
ncbi:uncharacterized protein DSM5745_10975 [Aspergillus mulundensis]|uniref:Uncharacterized protein n=1 Tax=Aspergillus mulundensis TaxID=1810919 RepID=A0A3D8QFL8_9EURO|nr:Uncharacterized protein DSM5745_10975 [Aspergillus mulundensis]RDW60517.1 Uncharacterized protein DSM5745_10975 [Aspergillus mulundensis]